MREVHAQVEASTGASIPFELGTMIEIPRAGLTADEIAGYAQFFSFGTNDYHQYTLGLSRDDAGQVEEAAIANQIQLVTLQEPV